MPKTTELRAEDVQSLCFEQEDENRIFVQRQLAQVRHQMRGHNQGHGSFKLISFAMMLVETKSKAQHQNSPPTVTPQNSSTSDKIEVSNDVNWHHIKNWSNMQPEEVQHSIGAVFKSSGEVSVMTLGTNQQERMKPAMQAEI